MLIYKPDIKQSIQHINSITHEGKVVLFGTDSERKIYYTVKQDGYENNYNSETGWENWNELEFPHEEDCDTSVVDKETKELTYKNNQSQSIIRSFYKSKDKSAVAPVQLVSALGHLYVFRQSKSNTLLVDRFVLDELTNNLGRKIEVRYKRSRKRYEPWQGNGNTQGNGISSFDSLNYRDTHGNPFYEPTTEISVVNNLHNGWFSVVLLPTNELDKYRWHIFAYNSDSRKVELISIRASEEGLFDVKDYTVFDPKPGEPEFLIPRQIPGIIRRSLDLKDKNGEVLEVVNGLSATKYDTQAESVTQSGETQLIKDKTKVMLVIPTSQGNTAALSFAATKDGTLSQISENPEYQEILRSNNRNILLPLNTLDEITAIGDSSPPPKGTITGMSRTDGDRVQITSENIQNLKSGDNIQIQGTRDYNGYHVARRIDKNTFEIEAKWVDSDSENNQNWQVGSWEVIPQEESGLVFDGIITAFEQTADGKLKITSPNHGLESGDGVQILDTQGYDGTYPVTDIQGDRFTINVQWEPGLAANVKLESRKRRGISFDGDRDYIAIPALELKQPSLSYSFGETYSAWIYVPEEAATEQLIIGEKGQLMQLTLNNNRVVLKVLFDEEIQDPNPVTAKEWVHYAGIFSYNHKQNQTTLTLCRNGQQVTSKTFDNQNPRSNNEEWNPEFLIGGTAETNFFTGKIADVQVWNKARHPQEIQDSMYLQLSGKEAGLVGYWRLGAIVEDDQREVVDFSVYGNNGTVYGDPFVSAVTLDRTLKDNVTQAVKYTNDETFAVTQRATYVESFEFKLDDSNIDPNNVDGERVRAFEFSYWGKAHRNSEDIEEFSGITENFQLENGWYKASARFTVPDDIKIVRSFELSNIKGNWKQLEIRKHRIQLISDAITEEKYTDEVELEILAAQSANISQTLAKIYVKESQEAKLINTITSLEQSPEEIEEKINDVQDEINRLEEEKQSLRQTLDDAIIDWKNYYQVIRNKKSGKALDVEGNSMDDGGNIYQYDVHRGDNQKWNFIIEGSYYLIQSKRSSRYLNIHNASSSDGANLQQYHRNYGDNELWRLQESGGYYYIVNKKSGKVIDVEGKSTNNGANVHQWKKHSSHQDHQLWSREQTDEHCNNRIRDEENNWNAKKKELNDKRAEKYDLEKERDADRTNLDNLKNQLNDLQEALKGLNDELIKAVSKTQQSPQSMKELNQDQRELVTNGGILGFVNPISSLNAIETCEGNVQLSYFDDEGKMRQTNFDATADSRNASFEQWIPDTLPLCLKFSNSTSVNCGDEIDLASSSFTVEFWAKRDEIANDHQFIISQGELEKNKGLHIGFRHSGKFTFAFYSNDLDTEETYTNDLNWHYWCCVYDSESKTRTIYRDGEVAIIQQDFTEEYQGSGNFILGKYLNNNFYFTGKLAEVRIWNVALSAKEVAVNHKIRLSGNEPGLLAYYPLNELDAVRDYSGQNEDASIEGSSNWWGCTAPIGKPKNYWVCTKFYGEQSYIELSPENIPTGDEITIECWAKGGNFLPKQTFLIEAKDANNKRILGIHLPWSDSKIYFDCGSDGNQLDRIEKLAQEDDYKSVWVHWAFTKNAPTGEMTIYRNGDIWHSGTGTTHKLPRAANVKLGNSYEGEIAEFCIWKKARTQVEIQADMYQITSGSEQDLVAYFPLNRILRENSREIVLDLAGNNNGTVNKATVASKSLISCEYSTIGLDPATNKKAAMMRRFFAFVSDDGVNILPDKRVETLELKWIGNAQFQPTLLGYIEGAPPVPSENLTLEDNYNNATSVELISSEDISYSWERSEDLAWGTTASLFSGVQQKIDIQKGIGVSVSENALETKAGFQGDLSLSSNTIKSSNVSSSSSLNITNKLSLAGTSENEAKFANLGKRFIPKNVGYALVVSGLADVYILRLTRSKQMVSYKIEPNEDIPLDVNTITFLINPSYTMNGSLDGMTGSNATNNSFFQDVPEMRSQYGSLYPASYFRLSEAYQLKEKIDYRDRQRQAYFDQFNTLGVSEGSLDDEINNADYYSGETAVGQEDSNQQLDEEINKLKEEINELKEKRNSEGLSLEELQTLNEKQDLLSEKQEQKQADLENKIEQLESLESSTEDTAADQKKKEIQARFESTSQKVHATESFDNWQRKMENIQILAGKRNIVNTYVWDADGGIYSESQQFANTFEHTIGGSFSRDIAVGGQSGFKLFGVGSELQAQATYHLTQTMTKTESSSKGFELNVDIRKVENRGITDSNDRPIVPGEKVDRYRFMSFYLEGSANNFNDFFDYVVDSEWLASNDEEARALRQVDTSSPNKTWRILHRVTYVERPTLKS